MILKCFVTAVLVMVIGIATEDELLCGYCLYAIITMGCAYLVWSIM